MAPGAPNPGTPSNDQPAPGRGGDLAGFDRAIHELHSRIADLRVSVDDLGATAESGAPAGAPLGPPPVPPPAAQPDPYVAPTAPTPAEPAPAPAYGAPAEEAAPYAPPQAAPYAPLQATPFAPPEATPYMPPQAPTYAPHPTPVDPYAPEPEPGGYPPPDAYPPNGEYPAAGYAQEGSGAAGTFSRVDVGPFEDLLTMTAFEEQLSALPSMADVRVRRFGHGRAEIELETVGLVPVAREMLRIAPDAQASVAEDGTLTVQLYDERWTGASAPEEAPADEEAPAPEGDEERDARG